MQTGATVAMMDGSEITRRRTAAASALAADYLARPDASTMTLVGAGALGAAFRPRPCRGAADPQVFIYNRTPAKAEALAAELAGDGLRGASSVTISSTPSRQSDIVSCVTTSTAPIVKGEWLKPGTHVDLAGAFKPTMRETDGEVVARASVYVDTRDGALAEAGDLLQARDEGQLRLRQHRRAICSTCAAARCRAGRRRTRSPCSSPAAPPSKTLPPPSWCIKLRPGMSAGPCQPTRSASPSTRRTSTGPWPCARS